MSTKTTTATEKASRPVRNQGQTVPSTTIQQSNYFVPGHGIAREVISADICRYLGNDVLVRPGHYEDPQTGNVVQGYYIITYRNLTTAMIENLKADSARWDNEKQALTSRNTPERTLASKDVTGVPEKSSSNSPVIQCPYSETDQPRYHHESTE